ncbi:MAG: chloride channel protein, partial [Lysobacteraceae bacterium]
MNSHEPDFLGNLRAELSHVRPWLDRGIVLAYATVAGLAVVGFTLLSEWMFGHFLALQALSPWSTLLWTPALTAGVVWCTRRYFSGAAGSGIPQVMAALDPEMPVDKASRFVSLRLTLGKIGLSSAGLLAGLSLGREGP